METWKWVTLGVVAALAALMALSVRGPVEQISVTMEPRRCLCDLHGRDGCEWL